MMDQLLITCTTTKGVAIGGRAGGADEELSDRTQRQVHQCNISRFCKCVEGYLTFTQNGCG